MSMISKQVERLRELAKQDKFGLIPWNGYSEILNQAADTIEQLAAKVREDNAYKKAFEDIRAEIETIIGERNLDDYDFCSGLICARKIIDKYKAESEGKE